jgi:hypothetical protein
MSCDHAVWFPSRRLSNEEAGALYVRLCEGDTSEVTPNGAIDAFYNELTAKHPQIDDIPEDRIDDHEYCPWSIAFDRSPGHLIMCCVWSRADYVSGLLQELARKHGLALYDPQSERIRYADDEATTSAKPWWKLW